VPKPAVRVTLSGMADTYDPPRIEQRFEIAPMLIGVLISDTNTDGAVGS